MPATPLPPAAPGRLRRLALSTYRRLPRRARLAVLRTVAPTHTVGALCLLECRGRVLMLRQHHRRGWTLPGGLVDRGESAEQAVVRELREEIGLEIVPGLPLSVVVDPRARRVDVLFHVPVDEQVDVVPGSEAIEAAWLAPGRTGVIDEPTAAALAMFARAQAAGSHAGRVVSVPAPPP